MSKVSEPSEKPSAACPSEAFLLHLPALPATALARCRPHACLATATDCWFWVRCAPRPRGSATETASSAYASGSGRVVLLAQEIARSLGGNGAFLSSSIDLGMEISLWSYRPMALESFQVIAEEIVGSRLDLGVAVHAYSRRRWAGVRERVLLAFRGRKAA